MIAKGSMDAFQYRQELHDRYFHHDIYTLSKPKRLTHLVLHQCKYVSRIHGSHSFIPGMSFAASGHYDSIRRICVDGIIICFSMANVCNKLLSEGDIRPRHSDASMASAVAALVNVMGDMAKCAEDVDHMDQTNPLGQMFEYACKLFRIYCYLLKEAGGYTQHLLDDPCMARLMEVERKHIFFDRHLAEIIQLTNTSDRDELSCLQTPE